MAPFFDPLRCPSCGAVLAAGPLRCSSCGVGLTGPTVVDLVTTLRRADALVDRMRAEMGSVAQPPPSQPAQPSVGVSPPPARSWFAGTSVGVILLILGALCVLAAGAVFIAVGWVLLPLAIRALILILITASFGFFAHLALRRGLQATAEAMAVIASGMFVLDLSAARRAGLPGIADLATAPYEIVAGALLVAVAGAGALALRSRQRWLWCLDAVVAFGTARAAFGALRVESQGYAVSSVTVAVVASLLFLAWRRLRLPVAMWSAAVLGGFTWLTSMADGAGRAASYVGSDLGRLAQAWPALAVALVAGLWSIRLTHPGWQRVAAFACLLPTLLIFEIAGWSHGWVVGTVVMLVGYVIAALASGHLSQSWSPAVGGSALVLALSAIVGLFPTKVVLGARIGLPMELLTEDVGPWLLPLTTLVVLGLLPRITIGSHRLSLDQHYTAGAFVATLGVMPVLYGAGFWASIWVLVVVAAVLLFGARLWRNDVLLVFALSLLAIMRIYAYTDDLADPLAWTLIGLACLGWALTERRPDVRTGFLTAAGLFALLGAMQWLIFVRAPVTTHGLVIVVVGSLGLLASQGLAPSQEPVASQGLTGALPGRRPGTRLVGEGLSVTWVVAGLAWAERSPSHGAAELTVAGVAAGITAYLSQDRRRAGWVSGVLLTVASWIRLVDKDIQAVEWYTLPAATALLVYGIRWLRQAPDHSTDSSLRCLGPGLALALTPSLIVALGEPVSWRGLLVGLASMTLVVLGVRVRLAAPFVLGVAATGMLAVRNVWPVAAFVPRWTLLFVVGGILLGMGMTWESRVRNLRAAGRYVGELR